MSQEILDLTPEKKQNWVKHFWKPRYKDSDTNCKLRCNAVMGFPCVKLTTGWGKAQCCQAYNQKVQKKTDCAYMPKEKTLFGFSKPKHCQYKCEAIVNQKQSYECLEGVEIRLCLNKIVYRESGLHHIFSVR